MLKQRLKVCQGITNWLFLIDRRIDRPTITTITTMSIKVQKWSSDHQRCPPPLWSLVTCTPAAALSVEKVEQALYREQPEQIFSTSKLGNSTLALSSSYIIFKIRISIGRHLVPLRLHQPLFLETSLLLPVASLLLARNSRKLHLGMGLLAFMHLCISRPTFCGWRISCS